VPTPKLKPAKVAEVLRKWEVLKAAGHSIAAAAREMGMPRPTLSQYINDYAKKFADVQAAREGHAPGHFDSGVAPGYQMGKVTVQRGENGSVERTWERQSPDQQRQAEMLRAAVEAMQEELPRVAPIGPPDSTAANLCNVFTFTDSHVGMMAWHEEGGADWDLKIAEATLTKCFEQMVASSPAARVALVNQLGDFLHYDSAVSPVTPLHQHVLDADGRMPKMVKTAIRILRHVVDYALAHHERVVVLLAEGNHDISSSVWLRAMFQALYENEPRVTVIDSSLPYYVHQHGATMLAFHHGHLSKNEQLPILFAAQFPKVWGATTRRYAHTGHRHHTHEKEHSGMTVFQHPTLAARDAYAARGGWQADRRVTALTYHTEFGEVARNSVVPEMVL